MQVNSISRIELIFADDYNTIVDPLCRFVIRPGSYQYHPGIVKRHGKPIAFIWHDSHLRPVSPKLIKWINNEFKPIFDYNPLKWLASVGTCSPELRKHLKDFHDRTC